MEPLDDLERLREMSRRPVELTYDTADYPLPAGIRRRDVTSRHLLYRSGELCLDLRVEREPRAAAMTLVGQLADADDPLKALPAVPVFLMAGEEALARATSNQHGEFQMVCEPAASMHLWVAVAEGELIEVPVDRRTTKRNG